MNLDSDEKGTISDFYKKVEAFLGDFVGKHQIALFFLIFFTSFLVKLLIINLSGVLGADYGAYLRWVNVLRGSDIVGKGLRYPPIYPSLLILFLAFFDEITALKACAAFVYSLIALPYFLLAKKIFGNSIFPIMVSLLITFNMFYSEMIGWGGNANILAFAFQITFLIFWVKCLKNTGSKKNIFLASLFLSLAVGSHYLLAAYLLIFFFTFLSLILFLRYKRPNALAFKSLTKTVLMIGITGLILSLPYLFIYKYLLQSAVIHETSLTLADQRTFGLSVYMLGQNLLNIIFLILGIIGILFLVKEDLLLGLTLSTLFISGCLPIFFTLHPARWVYFWPIPIFLGFPVFIKNLLPKLKRSHRILRMVSITGMALLVSTYVLCSVPFMYERFVHYGVLTPQVLDALEYLKVNTNSSSVIATSGPYKRDGEGGGHNYGWWIEGYANRRSVATAYLRFLIYYDEREVAEKANIFFSGTHVLLNNFVMAAETFPAGLGNPEIGVNIGDFYDKLLFFADDETIITCDHDNNITLSSIKWNITTTTDSIIKITYANDLMVINKSIHILDDSIIEVSFEINQSDGLNITRIFIPLFKADFVDLNGYLETSDKNILLEMITSMRASVKLNIAVDYVGAVAFSPSERGQEFAVFVFFNPKDAIIKFRFTLSKLVTTNSGQVRDFNAYKLIEQMKIDYIMINVNRLREFEWFSNDKSHFSKEFENEEIAIFKVIQP